VERPGQLNNHYLEYDMSSGEALGRAAYELVSMGWRREVQPGVFENPRDWWQLSDSEQQEWEKRAEVLRRAFTGITAENLLASISS
jgi:hypothetical protein